MATTIRYIGGAPEVSFEIRVDGHTIAVGLRPGETAEVPDDFAGVAPSDGDLGSGLLAQAANFVEVAKPVTPATQEAPDA